MVENSLSWGSEHADFYPEGTQFVPGDKDLLFAIMANGLLNSEEENIRTLATELHDSVNDDSVPTDSVNFQAEHFYEFMRRDRSAVAQPSEDLDILDWLLDETEETFLDSLEKLTNSEIASKYEWIQNVVSAILCRDANELKQQQNSALINSAKTVLSEVRNFLQHRAHSR